MSLWLDVIGLVRILSVLRVTCSSHPAAASWPMVTGNSSRSPFCLFLLLLELVLKKGRISMKHLLSLALATLMTASNFLVANGAPLESQEEAEINALCDKYSAAYKAKDASAITSLFIGGHPVLMPPNAVSA